MTQTWSSSELQHHGIKGMHWGQHRAIANNAARAVGKAAVTTSKAGVKVVSYAAHHKRMIAGGVIAAALLHDFGGIALDAGKSGILNKAAANRKAGEMALRSLSSTAAKVNYAKMSRGAFNITSMK